MKLVTIVAIALAFLIQSNAAFAEIPIACVNDRGAEARPVQITLDARQYQGRLLSCIDGPFVYDMTACAPNGGYGLSAPTGAGSLVAIVDRWQERGDHLGGATSYKRDAHDISFAGGYVNSRGIYEDKWSFTINRSTGVGLLKAPNEPNRTYRCTLRTNLF